MNAEEKKMILDNLIKYEYLFKFAGIEVWQPLIELTKEGDILFHIDILDLESATYNNKRIDKCDVALSIVRKADSNYYFVFEFINNLQKFTLDGLSIKLKEKIGGEERELFVISESIDHKTVDNHGETLYLDNALLLIGDEKEYESFKTFSYYDADFVFNFNGAVLIGSYDYTLLTESIKYVETNGNVGDEQCESLSMATLMRLKWASELKTANEGRREMKRQMSTIRNQTQKREEEPKTVSSSDTNKEVKKPSVFWLLWQIAAVIYIAYMVIHDLYYIMNGTLVDSDGNKIESMGFVYYISIGCGLLILYSVIKDIKKLMK